MGIDSLASHADALKASALQLAEMAQRWDERYRRGGLTDDEPANVLNACIKRLSRLLLPIVSTAKGTYGHDTFSFTPQSTLIPCLYDVAKLPRLKQAGPELWQLETQLVRERNRVSDALIDARALIEGTLRYLR